MGQNGLDLRSEENGVADPTVVEGLDPEAVAGQYQPLFNPVPQGEGEHAVEPEQGIEPPLGEGVEDDFGVAAGVELPPQSLED